jgi:hypothetical protein
MSMLASSRMPKPSGSARAPKRVGLGPPKTGPLNVDLISSTSIEAAPIGSSDTNIVWGDEPRP